MYYLATQWRVLKEKIDIQGIYATWFIFFVNMAMAVIIAMATGTFTVAIANACNSGLGENRVTAIAISRDDSGEARLWVGTACGLSCYRY